MTLECCYFALADLGDFPIHMDIRVNWYAYKCVGCDGYVV